MFNRTEKFQKLLEKYKIVELKHGAKEDKMGDAMEDYCVEIFNSKDYLAKYQNNCLDLNNSDEFIFYHTLSKIPVDKNEIKELQATKACEHRKTGGNPKTDIILNIQYNDSKKLQIPISVKSSTAQKVAMAEFDVDTIVKEVGIKDEPELEKLMLKHQIDASAKNFTPEEKRELFTLLEPYARQFVRWVLSGTPDERNEDLRHPILIVKLGLTKTDDIKQINVYTIEEYIDSVMLTKTKKPRRGGFGTGLSWTYATGSKGQKIQFKG